MTQNPTERQPGTNPDTPRPTAAAPGTTSPDLSMVPPSDTVPAAFDHALSALIDHLMIVQDHQLAIQDHQVAIDAALAVVCSLVEEFIP
jgi:hypothetical protein